LRGILRFLQAVHRELIRLASRDIVNCALGLSAIFLSAETTSPGLLGVLVRALRSLHLEHALSAQETVNSPSLVEADFIPALPVNARIDNWQSQTNSDVLTRHSLQKYDYLM
jgi:hypothetical protein